MKMLRIVHWRWITTLLDEFWLLAILGYSTSQVLVVQQSKHLQRTHHHCRPVESPPACPPPMQSSRITSSVSTTMAHRCWSWSIITSRLHGECVLLPSSLVSASDSSVSFHGVGGVLVVGHSMHQQFTFCSCYYWLMDEVCCEALLGNANRTVAVHVLCLCYWLLWCGRHLRSGASVTLITGNGRKVSFLTQWIFNVEH